MKIGQIAPAIAGGLEFSPQSGLPLKQHHPDIFIFRRSQRCRHSRRSAANNANDHIFTFFT
jgi:hypothetical protein